MTDSFLTQRRRSPASLIAIVAAHALVIAATDAERIAALEQADAALNQLDGLLNDA